MNGLDVFLQLDKIDDEIERLTERITRRRALAEGCTSRPLTPDGGGKPSTDASMKLVDYVADIEKLEAKLRDAQTRRDNYAACCVYLAECIPDNLGTVMIDRYVLRYTYSKCGEVMGYSLTHIRRLLAEAENLCKRMELTMWDGIHIPVIAIT